MKTFKGDMYHRTHLKNIPDIVYGIFDCGKNAHLENLKGAPKEVKRKDRLYATIFNCSDCVNLVSLKGVENCEIDGLFCCAQCERLESLEHSPKYCASFSCNNCTKLKNLKGAPETVTKQFLCTGCLSLESLEGVPKKLHRIDCRNCPKLKNLDPLLKCDIEEVNADKRLLEDYNRKKAAIQKHGYDKAMKVIEMMDDLV